jgi:NitT/TauT family transport system substrate-binding protein
MSQFSRRSTLKLAATGLIAGSLATKWTGAAAKDDPIVLRHGLQRGAAGALKVGLREVQDGFGLKYDQRTFNDATAVILAMSQKELDLGNVTAQHVVRAIDQGIDLSIVIGLGGGYNVLVSSSALQLAKDDLRGFGALVRARKADRKPLKIGVPTGSQQHLKLNSFLVRQNIDPQRDVDVVNVSFPDQVRALDGRQVDMVMTLASFASLAIISGAGKTFVHAYGPGFGKWEVGFAVRNDLIRERPELVQKIVSSHYAAYRLFENDLPKRIAMEKSESGLSPAAVEMEQRDFYRLSYRVVVDDIKRTAKEMADVGWVKKDLSSEVDKYVDLRFLQKATNLSLKQLQEF